MKCSYKHMESSYYLSKLAMSAVERAARPVHKCRVAPRAEYCKWRRAALSRCDGFCLEFLFCHVKISWEMLL